MTPEQINTQEKLMTKIKDLKFLEKRMNQISIEPWFAHKELILAQMRLRKYELRDEIEQLKFEKDKL